MNSSTVPEYLLIGEFSRETGYTAPHLRELEDQGVVKPLRTPSGVRLVSGSGNAVGFGRLKNRDVSRGAA
jgi:hypothetical protein